MINLSKFYQKGVVKMFERLIIATDLSKNSNALINCLGGLKAYGTKKCLLLQCLSLQEMASIGLSYKEDLLQQILQNQKEVIEKQGYIVETRTLSGVAKSEINRIAIEEDYSAIVVGAHKQSLTSEVFFSGLAYDVIHHTQKPVLLIRLEEHQKEGLLCIEAVGCEIGNHVLFPTDFSENADMAFNYVTEMAAGKAKKITLLHVQDKSRLSPYLENRLEEFNEIDTTRLQNMKKTLQEKGNAEVEIVIKYGSPTTEILNLVDEINVQLVVMGSQGRGFVKELFLGSVSHNIARLSSSSVLLIPEKRENE